ncbi:hypothetical protein KA977_11295, partial [Candidatus Dependentiae bacterium]|nr:hypothetical protein [Candidatus Dependentiae bacterium]
LIVATGRTSCSKPNVQNLPRKGRPREVFIPTEGYLLLAVDYSQIELITLALIIFKKFGSSKMLEIINSGQDLHIWFAALIYNKSISDITAEERQTAKSANFGFPGGLGIKSFIQFAKNTYGIILTEQQAKDLKEKWLKNFPEMRNYLENDFITKFRKKYDLSDYYTQTKKDNEYAVYTLKGIISGLNKTKTTEREYTQEEKDWAWSKIEEIEFEGKEKFTGEIYTKTGSPKLARALFEGNLTAETLTGRIRSNITFCASRNTPFQGLAADGAKIALYRLIKRGYRVVAFIHDEVIIELPIENCNHREEAEKISKIMIDSMNIVCPDVKVKTEYVLMKRWIKEAKATFDTEGRLIPYEKKF